MDDEELLGQPAPPSQRRRVAYLLAAAVLAAALLAGLLTRHHSTPSAQSTRTPAPGSSLPQPPGPQQPTFTPTLAHPLPAFGEHVELYARTDDAVIDVDLAAGSLLVTGLYPLRSTGPVSFVATSAGALVRPLDFVPGYLVRSGRVVRELGGALGGGLVLPGPVPAQVWAEHRGAQGAVDGVQLVDVATGKAGRVLHWPGGAQAQPVAQPDGSGYVLVRTTRAVYDVRPDGAHRLPVDAVHGTVLAAGGNALLVAQCPTDRTTSCPATLVHLPDGAARRLPVDLDVTVNGLQGAISPDGRTALVVQPASSGRVVGRLLDLSGGSFRGTPVPVAGRSQDGSAAFAPDGTWVFVAAPGGRLVGVDVGTGTGYPIASGLPPLDQLAVGPLLG